MEDSNKIDAETADLVENEAVELEMPALDEDFLNKEPEELTEEQQKEQQKEEYIKALKASKIKFNKVKQAGNTTTNKFGTDYQKTRQRKNKVAKQSRKRNLK